ncbi:MAG TPA: cation diffusion facilitator family transporter [Spirochaetota bacterium]|nr:cation transporter [Spirochaetota bacterium]HOD16821.1 cation diffusion facilitator family transporter [Spirochaetota bacterium]HPN11108.1 cation diffusion facilitator family transporter [Spirochaetota bacterium]HQL81049.1 cation diffusion facilitator family transporter [Spirochaetota bacterium]
MDHAHEHQHEGHTHLHGTSGSGKKFIFVILLNSLITVAEYIGGMLSGSLALISDAGHNLSDVLSLGLGYAGEKISERRPNRRFTFGLKRFEVAVALINALTLLGIGAYILYEAASRYLNPVPIDIWVMIPVGLIGLAGNLASILILLRDRTSTLNVKAVFLHLLYDAISSIAVIVAGIALLLTGMPVIDLAISVLIVAMMTISSLSILRESFRIFLQGVPGHINPDEVYADISRIENVESVHGLHIWSINSTETFLSCHIIAAETSGERDTDSIIKNVNAMLEQRHGICHTTLQVENSRLCSEGGTCCR